MIYRSEWRYNPVLGEYQQARERPADTGESSVTETLRGKNLLVIGATGFVGKVFLAMVMDRFPEVGKIVVQVRRKKLPSEQRFFTEIIESPPLKAVVGKIPLDELRRRVSVVGGDISEERCGIPPEEIEKLRGSVDLVINMAGLVEFDPPVTDSLTANVYGVRNLISLVQTLGASLVHISTCYVAGKRNGVIPESEPIAGYYPLRKDPADRSFDPESEIRWCEEFIRQVRSTSKDGRDTMVREKLREGGMQRAEHWGWVNTYTYTKAIGEQLIAATPGLRFSIVRPAIVESSLQFPFPGWNEGMTTSAPLVLMGADGVKNWPVRPDGPLEIIPVDLVTSGILIAAAETLRGSNTTVYHLATASENPAMLPRLVAFLGMNSRYRHKHKKSGNKLANLWKAYVETEVVTLEQLEAHRARMRRGLDLIHASMNMLKAAGAGRFIDPYLRNLRTTRRMIRLKEITLDKFLPFMIHNTFLFETRNIREAWNRLNAADRDKLLWVPEDIDWADYWVNVHTKGVERWVQNPGGRVEETEAVTAGEVRAAS